MTTPPIESNPLFDGTLSVKVAGVEYAALASGTQYESVGPGGFGAASFDIYPDDPFTVATDLPELVNEAAVVIKHGATPVTVYEGHIVGDPTIAKLENGESVIAVECGGLLDKAKYRQDYGETWVDTTYDNWQRHRLSDKGFADTIDGKLRFDVNDGQIFTAGDIAGIFYRVNQGIVTSPDDEAFALDFEYDLALASASWHCDIWAAPYYVDTLNPADWTTGLWAKSNTTEEGSAHVTGFPAGTRCIAFVNWTSGAGSSLAKRHAEITNLRVFCTGGLVLVDANIIPAMTSATAPSGVASASSYLGVDYPPWKAFNHLNAATTDAWIANVIPCWPQYQFPAAHIVTQYAVTSRNDPSGVHAPKAWTFRGSNDGAAWTTLDTQTNVTDWAASANVRKVFDFANAVAYAYYRLDITASNNATYVAIGELEMMESVWVSPSPTVDTAMRDCGVVAGLATASDTETIGKPLTHCVIPPSTTHADALDKFASMYEAPVDWGFWDNATLRVKKRLNPGTDVDPKDNVAIRLLAGAGTAPAAYLLDATTPAIDYDVHKFEEGAFDYVRAIFTNSRTNRVATPNPSGSTWPADWYRFPVTHVTAVAGTFQAVVNAGQLVATFQHPPDYPTVLRTHEVTQIGYRETIKAVTVPSGTTCQVTMQVTFFAEGVGGTGTDSFVKTLVGPLTNQTYQVNGTFNVPAGTTRVIVAFEIRDSSGTGTSTVQVSGVDVHDLFPGGMLRTVCAPSEPPADADVKVGILDLTDRGDLTVDRAFAVATQALAWIDSTLETGTIPIFSPTVPIYGGGTKLAAYIRASDWAECLQVDGHSPLWISSSHVDVDEGVVTLTIEPYPFDVAESDFGHAHMSKLRRWRKARSSMLRRQKAALRKAQAKANKEYGASMKSWSADKHRKAKNRPHRIHYI